MSFRAILITLLVLGIQRLAAQECGKRELDPQIAGFLKMIGYKDLSLEELRSMPIEQIKYVKLPEIPYPQEDVKRIKITADSIPVLVFNPLHQQGLPIIINYHGGGFISPLLPGLEHSLWQEAKTYGAVVFAVDYRTAPEHKFPAAVNDSYNAFKWIAKHGADFGGDTARITLMGNSAGANLVAVISQKAKKENIAGKIRLQVLNGLPADLRPQRMESSASYQQNAVGYFQTKAACYFAAEMYAPEQTNNPEVSPILTEDLSGLPPAVIINAEFDPLRDDGMLYASKLRKSGVKVWEKCFAGQIHCLIGALPNTNVMKEYEALVKQAMQAQDNRAAIIPNYINKQGFVRINGIEQWVTIKGDSTKPVVLFLHGGPGSPMSPYADAIYGQWEKDFMLVQWDQRGAGRTYGYNAPEELTPEYLRANPLTLEQMTADGIALARHLTKALGKKKIILFGSSWGSVLGVSMVQKSPELFYAYIGHSQVTDPAASNLFAYNKVVQLAQQAKDQASLDVLQLIGRPPYDTAKHAGQFMRIIKKYQQKNATLAPASWFVLPAEYDNKKDDAHRSDGDDYSFVNYTGDKRLGIAPMSAKINYLKDAVTFKLPVYFIQGEEDIQTPASMNKTYFDKIKAPAKKFILLPKTEHGFNQSVVDAHYNIMKQYVVPAIAGDK
jgi:acetyl esterase